MRQRITQKDVAKAAGVHSTTVSMVFRNHPSIPEKTRCRVRDIASKLGYTHDPMLSALAAYRTSQRPASYQGALAWLSNSEGGFDWKTSPHFRVYYAAVQRRASSHGYQIADFDIHAAGSSARRVAGILRARNITGVLVCPQPAACTRIEFPWEDFSAVTFGYTLETPKLHTVAASFYRDIRQTMENVRKRGYERIGLVLNLSDDQRFDHYVLASYLVDEFLLRQTISLAPLLENYREKPAVLRKWFQKYRPQVIVAQDWRVLAILRDQGIRVPEDVGFACAGLPLGTNEMTGVVEDSSRMGEVAVDLVVAMIQRGERGVPGKVQRILIEGDWVEGRTLGSPP
ncbi:MAG: hypothetical protein BGO12_12485 [Verrucomicrobia bacterium 61-8]|nr:MAG: hypothetical protein BGO12_12485 [Verrucomicrobia bacterium 61-8]